MATRDRVVIEKLLIDRVIHLDQFEIDKPIVVQQYDKHSRTVQLTLMARHDVPYNMEGMSATVVYSRNGVNTPAFEVEIVGQNRVQFDFNENVARNACSGYLQLHLMEDDTELNSAVIPFIVKHSLSDGEGVSEEEVTELAQLIQQANAAVAAANAVAEHPPYIGANGNWFVYSAESEAYADTGYPSIPLLTADARTGLPGTDVTLAKSGSAENPEWMFTIPRGDIGNAPYDFVVNGDFIFPVYDETAVPEWIGMDYGLPCWKGGTSVSIIRVGHRYVSLSSGDGVTIPSMYQYFDPLVLNGRQLTLYIRLANGEEYSIRGQATTEANFAENYAWGALRFAFDAEAGAYYIRINGTGDAELRMEQVCLFNGYAADGEAFRPQPRGQAGLMEVYRQFVPLVKGGVGTCTETAAFVTVPIPARMRAKPVLKQLNYGSVVFDGNRITPEAITVSNMSDNAVELMLTYDAVSDADDRVCYWTGQCALSAYVVE